MIRLGLRLAVAGGRDAIARLVIIAVAVAIGVGLLLATLAAINAVTAQNGRYAWLNTGMDGNQDGPDPAYWRLRADYYKGETIGRVDVAATGPRSPVPPGLPRLPGPGEYYVSPALSTLLAKEPAGQLRDRYPGNEIGTIGEQALPSPGSLLIVIGHAAGELSEVDGVRRVTHIATTAPGDCQSCAVGIRAAGMDLMLSVVAAGLLFPLLIFVGAATRLNAARREQRFAAMRLVGATPRQVVVIATVEAAAASVVGTAIGFVIFLLLRGPLAAIPFTGMPFYPADLSLNAADVLLVALGVPVGAATAAWLALRRVRISPLGVTRRVTPRPPRAYRLIPLVVGLGELAYFVGRRPDSTNGQIAAFLSGILVTMVGLIVAGPWLTMAGARVLADRSSRPATLIAARRLADNPQAGFRAISGLMLALFVTSVAVGVITTIVAHRGPQGFGTAGHTLMTRQLWPVRSAAIPAGLTQGLQAISGVHGVIIVRDNPVRDQPQLRLRGEGEVQGPTTLPGVVACADIPPDLGRCAEGATVGQVWTNFFGPGTSPAPDRVWPAAAVSNVDLVKLPVQSVVVRTDGSTAALERARTVLELAYPDEAIPPATEDDFALDGSKTLAQWRQLADVIILASLPIAGCSLAVSVAGGLSERKRPFSLLRLTGAPLRMLRGVVALESAVPLLAVSAVAIGAGLLAAHLFLKAQMGYTLHPPPAGYYVIVAAGLVASLGIIASTMPLLRRITGPETARNE